MRISKLLIREVGEAQIIPKGYGLAYWDFARNEGIFYPIPFNLIARFSLWFYWKLVYGLFPNKWESRLLREYERGWENGFKDGEKSMSNKVNQGLDEWLAAVQKEMDNGLDNRT